VLVRCHSLIAERQDRVHDGLVVVRAKEARKMLLLTGRKRCGAPSAKVRATVDSLTDVQKLEEFALRLFEVNSWRELLGLQQPSSANRGKKS
jgi:hypothetical protein